jgi:hypothetical protein
VVANPFVEPSRMRRTCCFGETVRSPVRSSASLASCLQATSNPAGRTSAVRPRGVSHTYAGRSGRRGHGSADGSPTRSPTETDDVRGHHRR